MSEGRKLGPLATERQKEYARHLGVEFSEEITLAEMSKLIDEAVIRQTEQRYEELGELQQRESETWQRMRAEVLAEIDAEDCRLSRAEPSQIVEALSERGLAAILFTFPSDVAYDIGEEGKTIEFAASFSDEMSLEDVEKFVKDYALSIWKRDGIDFVGQMEKTSGLIDKSLQLVEQAYQRQSRLKGR